MSFWKIFLLSFLVPALYSSAATQTALSAGLTSLQQLAHNAGFIFSGTVESVERIAGAPGEISTMQVTFKVEHGIRGAGDGQTLVIREWIGLWKAGERYRRGQRVFLFLYPTSKLGLTSPVGGALGRFDVDRYGNVAVEPWRDSQSGQLPAPADRRTSHEPVHLGVRDFSRLVRRAAEE